MRICSCGSNVTWWISSPSVLLWKWPIIYRHLFVYKLTNLTIQFKYKSINKENLMLKQINECTYIETGGASYHHITKTQAQQWHTIISFDFHYNRKAVTCVNTSTILLALPIHQFNSRLTLCVRKIAMLHTSQSYIHID